MMKPTVLCLSLALLAAPAVLLSQSPSFSSSLVSGESIPEGAAIGQAASPIHNAPASLKPFSRMAVGGGFSPLGVNLLLATNVDRHMNLRATGNVFKYTANNISTNGFNVDADLSLASAGLSLDYYPFPNHGLRLSPGVLFYNTNSANASFQVAGGASFTLDDVTYYASSSNPVKGSGSLGLHTTNPAFTITAGWGNVIPRKGGHWSFPVEIGVALIGSPSVKVPPLTGSACLDQAQTECTDLSQNNEISSEVQSNLALQVAKWNNDLDPLKTYPIVSFGVAYAFHIR